MGYSLSKRSWLGVGVEATSGTALTTPTVYHPAKSVMKGVKKREHLKEERGSRDGVYGIIDTTREGSIDPKGPFYADTSPYFMLGAFGAVNSAQQSLSSVYKHTFSLIDQPKTLTLFKNYDAAVYVGAYGAVEKWALKFASEGKVIENDVSLKHLYPVKYAGSQLTPNFSTVQPFAGYAPTITLGGTQTLDIDELSIEFDQKLMLWYPAGGSADFAQIYWGERNVKVDFTARFDVDSLFNHFFNGSRTDDQLVLDVKGPVIGKVFTVTLGAPSAGTFTLTYNGQTTAPIAYNATAAAVQAALVALSSVGTGNAVVAGSGPYTVQFAGALLNDGNNLTGSGTGLTGGSFTVSAATLFNQELNISIPVISYDSIEHDLSKDNVLIKAKAVAISQANTTGGLPLISAFVQNLVTNYNL